MHLFRLTSISLFLLMLTQRSEELAIIGFLSLLSLCFLCVKILLYGMMEEYHNNIVTDAIQNCQLVIH